MLLSCGIFRLQVQGIVTLIDLHLLKAVIFFCDGVHGGGCSRAVGPEMIALAIILHGSTDDFQNSPLTT